MFSFVIIGISLIVGFSLLGGIATSSKFWLSNFRPSPKKIAADVDKMKLLMQPKVETLIPWTAEETALLSLDQIDFKKKKRGTTVAQGTFMSIYQEPMVTYNYKKYFNSKTEDAVIYARTSNRAFEYRIKNEEVTISINNHEVGTLRKDGILYKNNRLLARINKNSQDVLSPILLHTQKGHMKELGNLATKNNTDDISTRALQLVDKQMNENEEAVFLSLVIFEMVKKAVTK